MLGYPAAGKSSWTLAHFPAHRRVNRDLLGDRSIDDLVPLVAAALDEGASVVLDNTYPDRASRASVVALGRARGVPVRAVLLDASIEDAQYNAAERLVRRYGALPSPAELKQLGRKDPNAFGPAVLFRYRKIFEEPTAAEGFAAVERVPFARAAQPAEYAQKGLLLDYDGTLRRTRSGAKYPTHPDDVEVLPGRAAVLRRYAAQGYKLLGVSNQSGVAKGELSAEAARACFARTHELLGVELEAAFCPHDPAPIQCYCRKPMPGLAVAFIERHKLARAESLMVGDLTTDRTFAARSGLRYVDQGDFFAGG